MKKQNPKENLALKTQKKRDKKRHHTQFYYSFLTIILLVVLIQVSCSVLLNITKVIAYHRKIATIESKRIAAEAKNAELKKDIKNFSTAATVESIARNNLKMAGKDEVLVIVNQQEVPQEQPKDKHKKIGFKNNEKKHD